MSAVADSVPHIRAMAEADLDPVMAIETSIYTHPWTYRNFLDSIRAGYTCHVMEVAGELIGYGVMMIAVREAQSEYCQTVAAQGLRAVTATAFH